MSGLAVPVTRAGPVDSAPDAAPGAGRAAAPESPFTFAAPPSATAHDPDVLGFLERDDRLVDVLSIFSVLTSGRQLADA